MVALLDKPTRLSLGIDTIERQIIYAALALREASSSIDAYTESIKIAGPSTPSDSTTPSFLVIGVTLDCARNNAFHSYLNILENINPYSTVTPPQYDTVPASTDLIEILPTEPNTVDTLEKLFYWSGLILGSSTYPSFDYFSQAIAESSEGFQIAVTITLPIDYGKYLLTNNLVESSIKVFNYHIFNPDQILGEWTIPPSIQFWGDPIADIATLKGLTGKALGSTHWVPEKGAHYTLIDSLPIGSTADDDLFVTPTTQTATEVWKKGGTGQGNGQSLTAGQIRDALESLTDTDRLDASAIQNLPTNSGPPGADGADGLSAYQIWLNNGNTGTEQDFLDSLVGATGSQGATGPQGATGSVSSANSLILNQITTPSAPGTGTVAVYAKSDGKIYKLPAGGVEEAIGTGIPQGGREVLTANRDYYISPTGSDSNNGLSAGSPFQTPQKYANVAGSLDRGIYSVTGNFAAGTYSLGSSYLIPKDGVGEGDIIYLGNTSNPETVIFTGTDPNGVIQAYGLNKWHTFSGIKFTNTGNGHIFNVQYGSKIRYKNCDFGSTGSGWHIVVANAGIASNDNTASKISATCSGFCLAFSGGFFEFVNATMTLSNSPVWGTSFILAQNASNANFYNSVFSGSCSGKKYSVLSSSSIVNSGAGTNLPGTIAGSNDGSGHLS